MARTVYKMTAKDGEPLQAIHIKVAEKVLGKKLPEGAVVHHADQNSMNNVPSNLVICPNRAYHNLIHQRIRALEACGNPNWHKCPYCKQYDDPKNLIPQPRYGTRKNRTTTLIHAECKKMYMQSYLKTYRKEKS